VRAIGEAKMASRMPASVEFSIKLVVCLRQRWVWTRIEQSSENN
jgi:hypothetical protein